MTLFDFILKEYITIMDNLLDTETVENNRILIEKERFKKLLEKYKYMKFRDKTKLYKQLNLILHDQNNYTLPVKDNMLNKTVRKVVFNYKTYETIKELMEIEME